MMDKFKRFITPVIATFMALSVPLLVHAASSENSVTDLNTEGNVQCNDYAGNKVIKSMDTSSLVTSGTLSGPDNPKDDNTDEESTPYEYDFSTNTLNFGESTTPIDFLLIKNSKAVKVFWYIKGGKTWDSGVAFDNFDSVSSVSLCYGLGNVPDNEPPELTTEGDQTVTVGFPLTFNVSATDDGLPDDGDPVIVITASLDSLDPLPGTATFTYDDIDDIWTFSWTPTSDDIGTFDITFTASDGELTDSETITITVMEGTPTCESINGKLDDTGITCDENGSIALVCNAQLGVPHHGFVNSDTCCICNSKSSTGTAGIALEPCDDSLPAGIPATATSLRSCTMTILEKEALQEDKGDDYLETEVSDHIELNSDPYYCITTSGRRTCYYYTY